MNKLCYIQNQNKCFKKNMRSDQSLEGQSPSLQCNTVNSDCVPIALDAAHFFILKMEVVAMIRVNRIVPKKEKIVRTRILRGQSLKDVAAAGNIPKTTLCRIERGFDATPRAAAGICAVLGKPFDELFEIVSNDRADMQEDGR